MLHAYRQDAGYYEERADGLLASALDGAAAAVGAFARHEAPLTPDGARAVVAAEHGQADWAGLLRHVADVGDDTFPAAYGRIEAHDVDGLRSVLERAPDVVGRRGTNGNDLLGMATATCDERLVSLLLERGADPRAANVHGWTALHQAAYSGLPLLVDDPQEVLDETLAWAARSGRADAIEGLVERGADVAADVYRGTALAWAAAQGRVAAIRRLVALGADPSQPGTFGGPAHGEGVTALHLAAQNGHADAIEVLLELGADPAAADAL